MFVVSKICITIQYINLSSIKQMVFHFSPIDRRKKSSYTWSMFSCLSFRYFAHPPLFFYVLPPVWLLTREAHFSYIIILLPCAFQNFSTSLFPSVSNGQEIDLIVIGGRTGLKDELLKMREPVSDLLNL